MMESGNLYVIAAPSGTGKTTLVKALTDRMPNTTVSISHTTRPKRPNEIDGIDYYFIDTAKFEQMIIQQDFLEHATIFDNYYGTSKHWVKETLLKGINVILEIDWQGHQQIKHLFPTSISIFIVPPSLKDLRDRLVTRNQDAPHIIKKRLADAKKTISHISEFDYVVVNDDFTQAVNDLKLIIEAGRLLQRCQTTKLAKLIENFSAI